MKTWSSTQKSITLSSAEADLVAAVKASTELIGIIQMELAWGYIMTGEVYVDSSAALAVVARKGNGKLRKSDAYGSKKSRRAVSYSTRRFQES